MLKKIILAFIVSATVAGCTKDPAAVTDLSRYSSGSFPA